MVKKPTVKAPTKKARAKSTASNGTKPAKAQAKPGAKTAKSKVAASAKAPNQAKDMKDALAKLDPKTVEQIVGMRSKIQETFGKVAMAMMAVPRYRNQAIADLQHMVLEPMMRDRVAIASSKPQGDKGIEDVSGIAIWASVSQEVDIKIREQIKTGTFPVRLKSEEWNSGDINWLLDVIAPSQKLTTSVIANFKQITNKGDVRIHPVVAKMLDPEVLKKMGASPIKLN